jgi:hypothetical protein
MEDLYHWPPEAIELSSLSFGPVSTFLDRCRFTTGVANASRRRRWPFRNPAGLPGPSVLCAEGEEHEKNNLLVPFPAGVDYF